MIQSNSSFAELSALTPHFNFASERLTRRQAADYLGMSHEFLEVDVVTKRHGIPYIKVGRKVFYLKSDLDTWVLARRHNPSVKGGT